MIWIPIDKPPTREGFYIVAVFDEDGNLLEYSNDWVYVKQFGNRIIPNSLLGICHEPTHYMYREDFKAVLESLPFEDESGEIINLGNISIKSGV